jgi:hypothetical protein
MRMMTTKSQGHLGLNKTEAGTIAAAIEYCLDNAPFIKDDAAELLTRAYLVLAQYGLSEGKVKPAVTMYPPTDEEINP